MELSDYYKNCIAIDILSLHELLKSDKRPTGWISFGIVEELKPSDTYCFFYAKFGPPNGLKNIFKNDSSDNLVHWEWVLEYKKKLIFIQGMNLRTEIGFLGDWELSESALSELIKLIKDDFENYGKSKSEIRKALEDWDIFVNPHLSLKKSIKQLKADLDALELDPEIDNIANANSLNTLIEVEEDWNNILIKYNRGVGLSMSLNIMIPILAESFINLLICILCRPDIKNNKRLFDSFMRANIDVKIQSLHINCEGFEKAIDWGSEECKLYNKIINRRNDLLHGNINIKELKHSEIFFNKRTPVFKEYRSIWKHSVGSALEHSRFPEIDEDLKVVYSFIDYVLSCLESKNQDTIKQFMDSPDLGCNKQSKNLAVLLPHHLVDMWFNY